MSRPAVAVFAIVAIEYLAATQLARVIGGQSVALALILLTVAGIVVFRRAAASLVESSVAAAVHNSGLDRLAGDRFAGKQIDEARTADRAMVSFGALLMIIPGLVTGVAGLLLLLPPVRSFARPVVLHRIQPWIRPNLRFGRGTMGFRRDVVDVDIVDDTDAGPPSSPAELS